MNNQYHTQMKIGVDLGGTKIRAGIIGPDNRVVDSYIECCNGDNSKEGVVGQIISLIDRFFNPGIELIGIGVPAIVDADGVVYDCVNIPSWDRVELKSILEGRFGVPVKVSNDCNCFARGVQASEIGKGFKDLVCMTLGTGVGSGIILGGQLYTGRNSGAGEIGCIQYNGSDYESWCSSNFFKKKGTSGRAAFEAANAGDAEALKLWDEFGCHIGELLKMCIFAYDPETIVIGGSIANAYRYFESSMMKTLSTFPYSGVVETLKISADPSGDYMLVGAVM